LLGFSEKYSFKFIFTVATSLKYQFNKEVFSKNNIKSVYPIAKRKTGQERDKST
jgi:hypothetical protein